ncbi:MAG: hypothetical protein PUA64_09685 [Treponema sp.]|nr:hypothetical protein [Treponema sp.]
MDELKDKNGLTEKEFLERYSDKRYDKPSVTADILVLGSNSDFSGLRILLVKRGGHPFLGSWALPGGFIKRDRRRTSRRQGSFRRRLGFKTCISNKSTLSRPVATPGRAS